MNEELGFNIWQWQVIFLFCMTFRPAQGSRKSQLWVPKFFSNRGKPTKAWGCSPPTSSELKNVWSYTSPQTFMAWCLIKRRTLPLYPLLDERNCWPFAKGIDHFLWNSTVTEELHNVWGVVNFFMHKQTIINVHKHNYPYRFQWRKRWMWSNSCRICREIC